MNFIFICPDEMRARSLGCYGHPVVQTPNIDRLAQQGTRFDQAHVQHTVCSPSRCCTLTGWYPHVAGHRSLWHLLQPHQPNMFKYLKEAGWEVRWIGKNDTFSAHAAPQSVSKLCDIGFLPTFDRPGPVFAPGEPGYYSFLMEPGDDDESAHPDAVRVQEAIDYLRDGPPERFALNLNLSTPHCPYWTKQPWHDMYDPEALPPLLQTESGEQPLYHELIRRYRGLDEAAPSVLRRVQAVYLGMISYIDNQIGRLMRAVEETGLAENTAIILWSDHGDFAGDYGLVEKWTSALDEVLTHVPLIMRVPGGKEGHVVEEPVEVFDIMPTTLDLADLRSEHVHFARSLTPQLGGRPGDTDRAVFAEGGYQPLEPHCFECYGGKPKPGKPGEQSETPGINAVRDVIRCPDPTAMYYPKLKQQLDHPESISRCTMIRTATQKLVRRPDGINELYDVEADPDETCNLYGEASHSDIQTQLEDRLLNWAIRTSDAPGQKLDPRGMPDLTEYGIQ